MRTFVGYSREEIYNMYPYERDILIMIHNEYKEKEKISQENEIDKIKNSNTNG